MKKLLALLLAFALVFSMATFMTACGDDEDSIVGMWKIYSEKIDGRDYEEFLRIELGDPSEEVIEQEMERERNRRIEFKSDGTVVISEPGRGDLEGKYEFDDGKLVLRENGEKEVYEAEIKDDKLYLTLLDKSYEEELVLERVK